MQFELAVLALNGQAVAGIAVGGLRAHDRGNGGAVSAQHIGARAAPALPIYAVRACRIGPQRSGRRWHRCRRTSRPRPRKRWRRQRPAHRCPRRPCPSDLCSASLPYWPSTVGPSLASLSEDFAPTTAETVAPSAPSTSVPAPPLPS